MKKLCFRYGAMNAAKTMNLLTVNYNCKELGLKTVIVVPNCIPDKKVKSRVGIEADAIYISELEEFLNNNKVDYVLVDEVQFLNKQEIELLSRVSIEGITVITYGLRTASNGELFEGAKWLLAWADEIEEIPTSCKCGRKARMNLRLVDGKVDTSNEVVKLRSEQQVAYVSVCRECYFKYYNEIEDAAELIKYDNTITCK